MNRMNTGNGSREPACWSEIGGLERLRNAHVLVLGVGGVGAYAAEQLARPGSAA